MEFPFVHVSTACIPPYPNQRHSTALPVSSVGRRLAWVGGTQADRKRCAVVLNPGG